MLVPSISPTDDAGRLNMIDRMMLGIVVEMFHEAMRKARFGLEFLRHQPMAFLAQAEDIPAPFRACYAEMLARIDAVLEAIKANWTHPRDYFEAIPNEPLELVWHERCMREQAGEIGEAVGRINAAAEKLRLTLDQIARRLCSLPPSMIAWDNLVEVRVWVEFMPIADRPSYAGVDSGANGGDVDPIEAKVDPSFTLRLIPEKDDDRGYNWNIHRDDGQHPLAGLFYGYLAHAVTDHTPLPEVLLPWIQDLWFEVYVRGDGLMSKDLNDEGPPTKLPFGLVGINQDIA